MYRIGQGFDFHRFGDGNFIVLGGVKIDFNKGIIAHSDGDVIIHSIMDAILGALALNDIGIIFPDTDESLRGIESKKMLEKIMEILKTANYQIVNVDITFIGEKPKIKDYREKIVSNLSYFLKIDSSNIGLKATTTEKMGFIGREEGIAAASIVLLRKISKNSTDLFLKESENSEEKNIEEESSVFVYTDGSCIGNPGPGGWAFIVIKDNKEIFFSSDGEFETTNNRMEIKAVYEALRYLETSDYKNITIFTDSRYVSNTLNSWLVNWESNGWKNSSKKDIANKDLWQKIASLLKNMQNRIIRFEWVRSHNNNFFNEKCDSLARDTAQRYANNRLL